MSAVDDLILQIQDKPLQERIKSEVARLSKKKRFGLVFEEHLPELVPIYSAKVVKGSLVSLRDKSLTHTWRVMLVKEGQADCFNAATNKREKFALNDLVCVREFGKPIFPSLVFVHKYMTVP